MLQMLLLAAAPPIQDWVRLPQPTLTRPSAIRESPREVLRGVHLPSLTEMEPPDLDRRPTEVSLGTVLELVDGAVRAELGNADLRVEAVGRELLLSGEARAVEIAREVLAQLDALDRALRIELDVLLVDAEGETQLGRWTGRSGDRGGVGTREETPYLGRYDVNLAADSAATEPESWSAWTGTTVHLAAARWRDDSILVEGHLDVATLRSIETFDPDDVDLGQIELPELDVVEVAFSGLIRPEAPLRVTLTGMAEGLLEGTLEVRLRSLGDLPRGLHWDALDLAAIAWPAGLPGAAPRDRSEGTFSEAPTERDAAGVGPASLALLLEEGGLSGGPIWSEGLLFVPPASRERAQKLLEALRADTVERRIRLNEGARQIEFPALTGRALRVVLGRERNRLERYRAQVAPEVWVLEPIVDRRHVGLVLEGTLAAGTFRGWAAERGAVDGPPLSASTTGSSALQRPGRRQTSTAVSLDVGGETSSWRLDRLELRLEVE